MGYLYHAKIKYSNALGAMAILVLLCWGCVYVDHLYHLDATAHHHCQLYKCLKYGVKHSHVVIENSPQCDIFYDSPKYYCIQKLIFDYLARSPPIQLI
ncbi:DUF2607 family protein [Vibrio neptunius]|nr:DUF2607 family protein [Vibrio neptunius]